MAQLKITMGSDGGCRVAEVAGEIDLSNSTQLGDALDSASVSATVLVVDLAGVGFCDATGLRILLEAHRCCTARGYLLRVVPSEAVARVIDLAGLSPPLAVYADRRRALAALSGGDGP